jgi:hypothetical protein
LDLLHNIGGFDGYQSGQKVYSEIASQADDTGRGDSNQQWWGNTDNFKQKINNR